MKLSAHKKFVLELRAPVEKYNAGAHGPGGAAQEEEDLGLLLEKKFEELFGAEED